MTARLLLNIASFMMSAILLAACGGSSSSGGSSDSAPSCTGSAAWCAPVGAAVQGATLYDGWEDLRIVPSPVNVKGGWTDSVAVTADGLHLYFGYNRYDVSEFFIVANGGPGTLFNPTGPARPGMISDNFQIFRADLNDGKWSVHYHPVNSTDPTVWQASASVNETQDLLVFSRFDPATFNSFLWYSTLDTGTGVWADPVDVQDIANVTINTDCTGGGDDNGFVIGTLAGSTTLYWESLRAVADGSSCGTKHHIYRSTFNGTSWTAIEAVPGLGIITGGVGESDDTQVSLTPDGQVAYWTRAVADGASPFYGLLTADWDGSTFGNVRPVITPTYDASKGKLHIQGELNVAATPEGWVGYLMCGIGNSTTPHDLDLYVCRMKKPAPTTINTSNGWSDSPFISRDGKRLYFMYSRWDFAPWIHSLQVNPPVLTGPDRPGLHKSATNAFDESDIYVATKKADGTWSTPVNLGLNGAYGDSSGMEINGGNTFVWLQGDGTHNNIVMATKNPDGTWGDPVDLGAGINDPSAIQDNPHMAADGNTVWFVSNRAGGQGNKDIWYSTWNSIGSSWNAPVNQGTNVNTSGDEDQPFISAVTNDVYWNGPSGLMHCLSTGSDCDPLTIETVEIPGCLAIDNKFAAEASVPDSGSPLYFACGDGATGRVTIMSAKKQSNGTWGTATPVD